MNSPAILIDFGSTYTKVLAVELRAAEVIGRSQAPSTVLTDVHEGLIRALAELHEHYGLFENKPADLKVLEGRLVLASSSAAGGLRMAVIGLVPGLTVEAANLAALGAGAKVVGSWSFKLQEKTIYEIESSCPDMILLTGGIDGGDSATILHNARLLAKSPVTVPIIVAGNQVVAGEVCDTLTNSGREVRRASNVMPKSGALAVESAREEIRRLFMERITRAKGLDRMGEWVPVVLPTPVAVLNGAILAAQGTEQHEGWGDMLVVDVGGATTDVHSIGYGKATGPTVIETGLPEPFAKRTVEGDLGIRFNAATLMDRLGPDEFDKRFRAAFPEFSISPEALSRHTEEISRQTAHVPQEVWHSAVDAEMARAAVDLAVERHAGRRERIVTREGEAWLQYGKDLSETRTLIGTGGVFVHNPYAPDILRSGGRDNSRAHVLRPKNPRIFVDSSYLLYAVGLLAETHPAVALRLFQSHIKPVLLPNPLDPLRK